MHTQMHTAIVTKKDVLADLPEEPPRAHSAPLLMLIQATCVMTAAESRARGRLLIAGKGTGRSGEWAQENGIRPELTGALRRLRPSLRWDLQSKQTGQVPVP